MKDFINNIFLTSIITTFNKNKDYTEFKMAISSLVLFFSMLIIKIIFAFYIIYIDIPAFTSLEIISLFFVILHALLIFYKKFAIDYWVNLAEFTLFAVYTYLYSGILYISVIYLMYDINLVASIHKESKSKYSVYLFLILILISLPSLPVFTQLELNKVDVLFFHYCFCLITTSVFFIQAKLSDIINGLYNKVNAQRIADAYSIDPLTNLLDLNGFIAKYNHIIGIDIPTDNRILAIMDVDFMTYINSTYSTTAGDFVLKDIASISCDFFKEDDIVARLKDDKFIILVNTAKMVSAHNIFGVLRTRMEIREFQIDPEHKIKLTVTIGVSKIIDNSILKTIAECEKNVAKGKLQGRNLTVFSKDNEENL